MTPELETTSQPHVPQKTRLAIIDTDIHNFDVHNDPVFKQIITDYLSPQWQDYHRMFGQRGHYLRGLYGGSYPRFHRNAARTDSWPPSGRPPGTDLDFMRHQLLDAWKMDYGILNPLAGAGGQLNMEYGAQLARAVNDYQVAEWLEREPRLRASILVNYEDGELAAQEIRRRGNHPGFVQVLTVARTSEPLGKRKYWKMYEAALEYDLPVGIHVGGQGGHPLTAAGWPSYYLEDHCGMPQAFQAHIASFVCEGVFEHFPELRIVIIEGGFAWVPSFGWRMDRSWKRLKAEVPFLKKAPSEYIQTHFWFTTQPMEEPRQIRHLEQLLGHLDGGRRLMFATDYPHWDFDSPDRALPGTLPYGVRRNIMSENARRFYRLP